MINLQVKRDLLKLIAAREIREDYREINSTNTKKFNPHIELIKQENGMIDHEMDVCFKSGYGNEALSVTCRVLIKKDYGIIEWGAKPNTIYYVLKIKNIIKLEGSGLCQR